MVDAIRREIAEWVLEVDEEMLLLINQLKQNEKSDWWTTLTKLDQEKIIKGKKDIKDGKTVPHEVVKQKYGL